MSVRSDIRQDAGWFRYEAKSFDITVTDDAGDPVDLSATTLLWRLLREAGSSTVYLEKTDGAGITVGGVDDNVVTIAIDADTDYDDLPAGVYHHELWDTLNAVLLSYGDAWLNPSTALA